MADSSESDKLNHLTDDRGLQTTARGPNPTRESFSTVPRTHLPIMKKSYIYEAFVDLRDVKYPETITLHKISGPRAVVL